MKLPLGVMCNAISSNDNNTIKIGDKVWLKNRNCLMVCNNNNWWDTNEINHHTKGLKVSVDKLHHLQHINRWKCEIKRLKNDIEKLKHTIKMEKKLMRKKI